MTGLLCRAGMNSMASVKTATLMTREARPAPTPIQTMRVSGMKSRNCRNWTPSDSGLVGSAGLGLSQEEPKNSLTEMLCVR